LDGLRAKLQPPPIFGSFFSLVMCACN
jgi:hypothetical protein